MPRDVDYKELRSLLLSSKKPDWSKALKQLTPMEDEVTFRFMLEMQQHTEGEIKRTLFNLINNNKGKYKIPTIIEHLESNTEDISYFQEYFQQTFLQRKYIDLLIGASELEDNAEETVQLIRFMSYVGNKEVFEVLTSLVSHDVDDIKMAALEGLDKFDFPNLGNTLLLTYRRESDEVAKKVLDIFLKRRMVKESVSLINSIFKKSDELRTETVKCLSMVNRNELKRYLGDFLKRDEQLKARVIALFREEGQEQLAKDIESAAWVEKDGPRREEVILVLSGVFLNRFNFCRMLGTTFNVQEAKNLPELREKLKTERVDLILMDVNIMHVTVDEVVTAIRAVSRSVPIVPFFSDLTKEQMKAVRKHNLNYFIIMPCQETSVFTAINQALNTSKPFQYTKTIPPLKTQPAPSAPTPTPAPPPPAPSPPAQEIEEISAAAQEQVIPETPVESETPLEPEALETPEIMSGPAPPEVSEPAEPEIPEPAPAVESQREFAEGAAIFKEGDPADCCYVIKSGRVRLVKQGMSGGTIKIAVLEPGDIFGEMSVLSNSPRTVTAIAVVNVVVEAVSWNKLLSSLQDNPKFARQVTVACSNQLKSLMDTTSKLQEEMETFFKTMQEIIDNLGG